MKFENTVTLGNVLTAISMTLAGAAAWTNMSERITRSEQAVFALKESDARHETDLRTIKADNRELMLEIKADIKELRNELRRK